MAFKLSHCFKIDMTNAQTPVMLIITLLLSQSVVGSSFDILKQEAMPPNVFTQGFEADGDRMYFSSGGYGKSFVQITDKAGNAVAHKKLSKRFFSEGLTIVGEHLYVLTWKREMLLVFDKNSLDLLDAKHYQGEGWGLTHNGEHFILSDGSNVLQFKDAQRFSTEAKLSVKDGQQKLTKLNELEFAQNMIWANAWKDDHIYAIDPTSGSVIKKWNLAHLRKSIGVTHPEAVLNGIAYDEDADAFWITGKLWPKRFLIKFNFD